MIAIKGMKMPKNCGECDCSYWHDYCGTYFCSLTGNNVLENQKDMDCPLVEIQERKKGKWIKVSETEFGIGYQCSECGRFILTESIDGRKLEDFPYCHCGTEMEVLRMSDAKLTVDAITELQNEIATQREVICNLNSMNDELQEKIAKQEQVNQELWAENEDLEKKLEKINQIIDSADIKTWGESSIVIRIREVLE